MVRDEDGVLELAPFVEPLSHHIAWVGVAQWLIFGGEMITDDPPTGVRRLD